MIKRWARELIRVLIKHNKYFMLREKGEKEDRDSKGTCLHADQLKLGWKLVQNCIPPTFICFFSLDQHILKTSARGKLAEVL